MATNVPNFDVITTRVKNNEISSLLVDGDLRINGEIITGNLTLEGDLAVNGGAITSTATTFDLLNNLAGSGIGANDATAPTTINFGTSTAVVQAVTIGQAATGQLATSATRAIMGFNFGTGPGIQCDAVAGVGNAVTISTAAAYGALNLGGSTLATGSVGSIVRTGVLNTPATQRPAAVANIGATTTLTPAQIMTGIVQVTAGGVNVAYLMPQRAAIVTMFTVGVGAGAPAQVGDSIEWTLLNLDGTPGNYASVNVSTDGHSTVVGSGKVAGLPADDTTAVSSGRFLTQLTNATAAGATTVTYRLC